jgi:hypothetical protein
MSGSPPRPKIVLEFAYRGISPLCASGRTGVPMDVKELIGVESGKKVWCRLSCNLQSASARSAASTDIARVDKKVR